MANNNIIEKTNNLDKTIPVDPIGYLYTNETQAHQFIISCTRKGEKVILTGSVTARFVTSQNTYFVVRGSIVDGNAVITLHQDCYSIPGHFDLAIFVTSGTVTTVVYAAVGTVKRTDSEEGVITGEPLPTLDELLAVVRDAQQIVSDFDDIILVQDTQPTSETNRIWVQPQANEYQVPTLQEHEDLAEEIADLKSAFDSTALVKRSSTFDAGTSTAANKRLMLNADEPLPDGAHIGALYMVTDTDTINVSYRLELANFDNGTYTVYKTINKTVEINGMNGKLAFLFDVDSDAIGNTYLFAVMGASYKFRVANVTGKKMYVGDDTTSVSFTTRTVNNYEIDYQVYYGITDDVFTDIQELPELLDDVAELKTESANHDESIAELEIDTADLQRTVSNLSAEVSGCISFGKLVTKTYFELSNDPNDISPFAKTKRWFINKIFEAGTVFDKIEFSYWKVSTNQRTVYVELWENSNGTLTKVKSVPVDITSDTIVSDVVFVAEANLNYTNDNPCFIAFCLEYTGANGALLYTTDSTYQNRVLVSNDVDPSTNSLSYSSLSPFTAVNTNPSIKLYCIVKSSNVVTIGDGMNYSEIQDALEDITDDTADNPYTFLIMPRKEPYERFSTIRKLTDPYITSGRIRYISMIGIDKKNCVIRSDSGDYKAPCAEIMINGLLSNLTFVMTNDEQTATAEKGGYCLHIDFEPTPAAPCNMTIENCDFEDASGPCLGIGLRENNTLTIRNCNFHTTLPANYAPHSGYRNLYTYGCLFAHTSSGATTQGQRIIIDNCFGLCEAGARSLNMIHAGSYDQSTADFKYTLMRNVFWNNSANAPAYNIDSDLTASPYNFGNNMS